MHLCLNTCVMIDASDYYTGEECVSCCFFVRGLLSFGWLCLRKRLMLVVINTDEECAPCAGYFIFIGVYN